MHLNHFMVFVWWKHGRCFFKTFHGGRLSIEINWFSVLICTRVVFYLPDWYDFMSTYCDHGKRHYDVTNWGKRRSLIGPCMRTVRTGTRPVPGLWLAFFCLLNEGALQFVTSMHKVYMHQHIIWNRPRSRFWRLPHYIIRTMLSKRQPQISV